MADRAAAARRVRMAAMKAELAVLEVLPREDVGRYMA
jgi:hypothetical protein